MKQISWPLTAGLIAVALIIGMAAGYYLTPEYRLGMYEKNMDLGRADRGLDLRYINAMAAHHRGAILLANQAATNANHEEIKKLAAEIQKNEPGLIQELYNWKKDWYNDSRTAPDPIVAQLGEADPTFDLRFLNALIAHHEAGIVMTKEVRQKSSRGEILNNADGVENFLTNSLKMLKEWRKQWYNI